MNATNAAGAETPTGRLLIANLDAEVHMARASSPGPHPSVSRKAAALIASAGSHIAILGRPGDRLWLPASAAAFAPQARRLIVETGPLEERPPPAQLLAWAETDDVADLRSGPEPEPESGSGTEGWKQLLWRVHASPVVVRRLNHRGFAFRLAAERGWSLPGTHLVTDLAQLDLTGADRWIAKAPYSAGGRERVRFGGPSPGLDLLPRLERLLSRYRQLLVEPWVDRVFDLACVGLVSAAGRVMLFPPHKLESDRAGVFRAARIADDRDQVAPRAHRLALSEAAEVCGDALARAGYRGPFGVDAYSWRDRSGQMQLQRVSEINARLTFGHIARAVAEDAGLPAGPLEFRL